MDPDNLYHTAHARLYWANGPFFTAFPWAAFSIISRARADLWWGFHVLFAWLGIFRDPVLAMRVGIATAASLHVLILGRAYARFGLPRWWALLSATVSAGFLSRLATLRPQVFSSALIPLLFAELWNRSLGGAIAVGALIGLFHPTLAYVLLPIYLVTALGPGRGKSKAPELASLLAVVLCAPLRPNPAGGLLLLRVQTWDLLQVKRTGLVFNFGNELSRATWGYFLFAAAVPLGLVLVGLVLRRGKPDGPAIGALLLTLVFLAVFLGITKRGVDQVAPFAFLTFVLLIAREGVVPKLAIGFAAAGCLLSLYDYGRDKVRNVTPLTYRMRGASAFLAANTPPGSVVYHTVWSQFAELFFWNRRNRYLGGMDPTFQWAVSRENYFLATPVYPARRPGWVGKEPPPNGLDIPLYDALPRYFGSRWIVLGRGADDLVLRELRSDPSHYLERYKDARASVFEIVPNRASGAAASAGGGATSPSPR